MGHFHNHTDQKNENHHLIKITTTASVATALIIILFKAYGWFQTNSLGIMASLIDSSLDIVASLLNLIAARYALMPPDDEHRFGHGKAEDLAVFFQSVFFNLSAAFLFASACTRLMEPTPVENSTIGIEVMTLSCLVTVFLILLQNYTIKKTKSRIVAADKLHYLTDLLTNGAILLALGLGKVFGTEYIDPIFALGISIYIFKGAFDLLKPAFMNLMDHELSHEKKRKIAKIINSHPQVIEFHDLKTRYSGNKPFIQFHLELNPKITLQTAYDIAIEIENQLLSYMPDAEIMIRKEPTGMRGHVKDYKD
jgi:ferrous-iron efflux pump FieF